MAPKRKVARNYTRIGSDTLHWDNLKRYSAYALTVFHSSNSERLHKRRVKRQQQRDAFKAKYRFKRKRGRGTNHADTIKCLVHWVKYLSWGFCNICGLLEKNTLTPKSFNSKGAKNVGKCICKQHRYIVPTFTSIPLVLSSLTKDEESILRLFDIDIGPKKIAPAGHRIKNGAFELRYRTDTVEERVEAISNSESKLRVQAAFNYLSESNSSAYNKYLAFQKPPSPDIVKIKFWRVYKNMPAIECAIWPVLYPFTSWCESIMDGSTNRESTLTSFRCKLLCNIIDYNNNFPLLQFQYDRWLFKTITGAVTVGHRMKTSPARALETKAFCSEYWRWQHRFLQDAVFQLGNPSLFLTISPYEWDFPKPRWVERAMTKHDFIPTACGAIETLHIAHTLEQICKGYIAGSNTADWESHTDHHVFHDTKMRPGNVSCVFFRFEYQKRRTIHLHMLVWLKSISNIKLSLLSATIPEDDEEMAFLVDRIQGSDHPSPFLTLCNDNSSVHENKLRLKHTKKDAEVNLRAYIPTVIGTLNSRMDVQASDGKAALMKYVSSYVTKLQEPHDALRSTKTTPFQVAMPFLINDHPGEPEMAMAFSKTSMSYCNLSRYKLVPPVSVQYFEKSSIFKKYMSRPSSEEGLTCLQYCRQNTISKSTPTCSSRNNLVGVKYKYIFSKQFFFQYTIVNTPFRELKDITHPSFSSVRDDLKGFSFMIHNHHDFLSNHTAIKDFLTILNYKQHKIDSFLNFKDGLAFLFYKTLNTDSDAIHIDPDNILLNTEQKVVYDHVIKKLIERSNFISECDSPDNSESSDSDTDSDKSLRFSSLSDSDRDSSSHTGPTSNKNVNVTLNFTDESQDDNFLKPTLLSGKPGTGKSLVIKKVVQYCIGEGLQVLFACPTAYQGRQILSHFENDDNVNADTIHSLFKIPVHSEHPSSINWSLVKYDIVIIDEVAMVDIDIMSHIFNTAHVLPTSPFILMAGDPQQQKPLKNVDGSTSTGQSIFSSNSLLYRCDFFTLYKCIRSECGILDSLLDVLRHYYPSTQQLEMLNDFAFSKEEVSDETVENAFTNCPNATFLTISKKASYYINEVIIKFLFSSQTPLIENAPIANDLRTNIYEDMRVILTQNICKSLGIVNGQTGVVCSCNRNNIIIRLSNGILVPLHKISEEEDTDSFYPLLPNYAMTIFKVQGKTLPNIVLWLDNHIISPGAAYVALSRVRCHNNIRLLQEVSRNQLAPIT